MAYHSCHELIPISPLVPLFLTRRLSIVFVCITTMISLIGQLELAYHKAPSGQFSAHIYSCVCHLNNISFSIIALFRTASVINSLLLLSGDIELNPGPESLSPNELGSVPQQHNFPKRESLPGQPTTVINISKAEELNPGDHILYQITHDRYRKIYCSALVIEASETNEHGTIIEVITNSTEGVSKRKVAFDELRNLHRVEYSFCQYDEHEALCRARKHFDEQHYDSLRNNSHHFVTLCKTGQEHPLTDILKSLEYIEENHHLSRENSKLNYIVFKTHVESVDDLQRGSHIMIGAVHYLVESIDSQNSTFSAYSICKKKRIKLFEQMVWSPLEILNCTKHLDSNTDEALIRAKEELDKISKRMWSSSDFFVTSMLCGVGHSIQEQYLLNHDVAPSGCALVTPKVSISIGDHLVYKDLSNNSRSVIVQEYFSDTRVIVKPPPAEGEEMDLTTYPEVYRVDYCECLPAEEVVKRTNSQAGENILSQDQSCFATWAKTGRETTTIITDFLNDMPITKQRRFSYENILSLDEIKPGDHLLECIQGRRRKHFMVTERGENSSFKVILCHNTFICEEKQILKVDSSEGLHLYRVSYVDKLLTSESESSNLFVRRARSYLGQQLHSPWAHMLFITWAITGAKEDFERHTCSQPVSKNRITSFRQVIPGDYLYVKPLTGWKHHYLIVSIHSSEQCTAIEYYREGKVSEVELTQSELDKFPWYYRIDYEPGACLPNEDSVTRARQLVGPTRLANTNYETFVHKLKTEQELKVNIDELPTSSESGSSRKYLGEPQFIQPVTSLDNLTAGDHIMYRVNQPPFSPVYRSALVLQGPQNQQVEIVTMTSEGIVKQPHDFKSLPNLHQVVYHSCCYSQSKVITHANMFLHNKGRHNYDERFNNSHHFVTRCRTDREYSLNDFVKELALKEQGGNPLWQKTLKPVLTKVPLKSIEDLNRGDHIVIESKFYRGIKQLVQHYLVRSVDNEHDKLSVFTTTIHKNITIEDKHNIQQLISESSVFLIEYDTHSALADTDMSLEMARREIALNSKWQRSDLFVTKMKCGTEHFIDGRCFINCDRLYTTTGPGVTLTTDPKKSTTTVTSESGPNESTTTTETATMDPDKITTKAATSTSDPEITTTQTATLDLDKIATTATLTDKSATTATLTSDPETTTTGTSMPDPETTTVRTPTPNPETTSTGSSTPDPETTTTGTSMPDPKTTTTGSSIPDPETTTVRTPTPNPETTTSTGSSTPDSETTTTGTSMPDPKTTTTGTSIPDPETTTVRTPTPNPETTTSTGSSTPDPETTTTGTSMPDPKTTITGTSTPDVVMVGCTRVTSHTSVDEGDHLLINDSGRFYSVLVCRFINQASVVVIPPIKPSQSLHDSELGVVDLSAYEEVYRVNYSQSLPSAEVIERAQSCVGKDILRKPENQSNYGPFVAWAKTGREMQVPVQNLIKKEQIEVLHPLEYKKILSPDELQVGQHIFRCEFGYRQHFMITEINVDCKCTRFRVIYCLRTFITEEVIDLDPGDVGKDIYQIIYQDELPTEVALKRARSLKGKHNYNPHARMWFVPWAKTGSDDGIEVDLLRNLTKPASKSRIICFTQLNEGDYLVEEKHQYVGRYRHYLIESVESPEKCTVIENWNGWIKRKVLNLGKGSTCDHPWFYRINYESGICISAKESIVKAQNLMKQQRCPYFLTSEYSRRSCIHYLKTGESADININRLLDDRTLLQREVIKSAMELKPGDHIERPLSLAPSYAQHHMLVMKPIDDKHCEVIHYKVNRGAQIKTGEVVMETVNIFDQKVCFRVCYSERIDPETGMDKLRKLCGKKGKVILRNYTGNEEYNVIDNNCEHLVMIATLGFPLSIQVDKFIHQALQTGKGMVKSVRTSCLHHGIHLTPEGTMHGAFHAGASGGKATAKAGAKAGAKAAAYGSTLGTVAGIAFAVNVLIEAPLCARSIYKLSRQNTFGKISTREYRRRRDTSIIVAANTVIGGTLGAVAGQVAIPVPIAGAAVGGVVGNVVGQGCGHLEAKLYCSYVYPDLSGITLPKTVVKQHRNLSELVVKN